MPAKKSNTTVAWHLDLLAMLPTRGTGMTAAELTQGLAEVHGHKLSKRSIERCLRSFPSRFAVTHDDEAPPFRWRRLPAQSLDLPSMQSPEALSLSLLADIMRQLMPVGVASSFDTRLQQARESLDESGANRFGEWTKRARFVAQSLPSIPPNYPIERLKIIQEAVITQCQLQVDYLSPTASRKSELILHPLGFVQKGNISYLVATAFTYKTPWLYALHRMTKQKLLTEPADILEGFSIDEYIANGNLEFGGGPKIKLQAILSSNLPYYLTESRLSEDQVIKPLADGRYKLTATVTDSWQLSFWILSQSEDIVVEKPIQLRNSIRDRLKNAFEAYDSKLKSAN